MNTPNFRSEDHARHNNRRWNGQGGFSNYGLWHLDFVHILLGDDLWQSLPHAHLDPYGFVMQLYDAGFSAQEATEIFVRADAEKHARQMEALEVGV